MNSLPSVDAGRARRRIRYLVESGCTRRAIAAAAGLNPRTVNDIAAGRKRRIFGHTSAAILAVSRRAATDAAVGQSRNGWVSAAGTRRRTRALAAIGYSTVAVAARAGVTRQHLREVAAGRRERVTAGFARAITAVYEEWAMMPATDTWTARRTARWARTQDWPPPAAWDEARLDDPSERVEQSARAAMRTDEVA